MLLQLLILGPITSVSGCLWFTGTQLYFRNVNCISQARFSFPSLVPCITVPRLADFSLPVFFSRTFSFPQQFSSCHFYGCSYQDIQRFEGVAGAEPSIPGSSSAHAESKEATLTFLFDNWIC